MKDKVNIAILIMAAGQSSRMKDMKQLLPWKGTNLLLHTLSTLLEVQKEHMYMVLGANADLIIEKANLTSQPVTIIQNDQWEKGLGSSISCGVSAILEQNNTIAGILVCLADQPLVTSAYYKTMLEVFKADEVPIVATRYPNKSGVPAIFNTDVARELTSLSADYGARHLMARYKNKMVVLDAGDQITDIDTPETYSALYNKHNS